MTSEPGCTFSHTNCSAFRPAPAADAAPSCQRTVKRSAGPRSANNRGGSFSTRTAPQADGTSHRQRALGKRQFQPRPGHAGHRKIEPGRPHGAANRRPQQDLQAVLARLGHVERQRGAVWPPTAARSSGRRARRRWAAGSRPRCAAEFARAVARPNTRKSYWARKISTVRRPEAVSAAKTPR